MGIVLVFAVVMSAHLASCLDPYAVITKTGPVMDAIRGSTFEIRCDAINRPELNSVRWERLPAFSSTGKPTERIQVSQDRIPEDQQKYGLKFTGVDTYILIIKNIDVVDEGDYYCQMQLSRYIKVWDEVYIRVVEAPTIDPMKTSPDQFVAKDDSFDLSCGAFGIPAPLIKWTRAGNGLMPTGGFVKLGEKLTINKIQPQFRGPYICTASNDIGEAYRTINVNMDFAPQMTTSANTVYQMVGYETRLTCQVEASPAATVTWNVGIGKLDPSRHNVVIYQSAFKKVISKLTIYKVQREDYSQNYTCVGYNSLDSKSLVFQIKEASEPQPIAGQIRSSSGVMNLSLACLLIMVMAIVF